MPDIIIAHMMMIANKTNITIISGDFITFDTTPVLLTVVVDL